MVKSRRKKPQKNVLTNTDKLTRTINPNGYCLGYITGIYDGWTTSNIQEILKKQSCPPADSSGLKLAVSNVQMVAVFMKWATDYSESLNIYSPVSKMRIYCDFAAEDPYPLKTDLLQTN